MTFIRKIKLQDPVARFGTRSYKLGVGTEKSNLKDSIPFGTMNSKSNIY